METFSRRQFPVILQYQRRAVSEQAGSVTLRQFMKPVNIPVQVHFIPVGSHQDSHIVADTGVNQLQRVVFLKGDAVKNRSHRMEVQAGEQVFLRFQNRFPGKRQ